MTRARPFSFLLLAVLSCALPILSRGQSSIIANAPIKNFRLPSFNDQGQRLRLLRGSEARYINNAQIDIVEMNLTEFRGDGSTDPQTLLLAPSASVFIKSKNQVLITGKESVRLIGNGIEATGENWSYDHKGQRLTMNKNVRVVFAAQLKGILD